MTQTLADNARAQLESLMSLMTGDEKHSAAATSTLDVLWVLYDHVLDIAPDRMDDPTRDRFLLSKGHGPMAYYAVLAAKGFIPVDWLRSWGRVDSPLGFHPDRTLVPGVEISSGSLCHGLPLGVGVAAGLRAQRIDSRVVVLVGDAELDEGSNAEAIELAAGIGLGALTVVVIDNQSSTYNSDGLIAQRFSANRWRTRSVDGRDHAALTDALGDDRSGMPTVVVARVEAKS
ncbi:transketolase [Rudaeicoccus suwonensis]|uniref:Transketolase n=1 Tax=Rudaeicoccus suwonensis TaxID=657409 RepID=A0A561E3P2_9MICO|nr:transketolase [Rudaeicoccus suwonensis]TWE10232.1 transketolase [Rudaeicoccus suwonensis]